MNKPNPKNDGSHPRRAAALARNENVDEAGVPPISPAEWQEFKRMEALNERAKIEKLKAEYEAHRKAERRFKA